MKTLHLCTTSSSKVEQFSAFFGPRGYEIKQIILDVPEVQSVDPSTVASEKIRIAARLTTLRPLLVDDAGIQIDVIEGFPGALLKPVLEHGCIRLLGKLASLAQKDGRARATLVCSIVVDTGSKLLEGRGLLEGLLDFSDESRWDDIDTTGVFFPDGEALSLKQLRHSAGDAAFSHRFDAMKMIHKLLELDYSHFADPHSPGIERSRIAALR